MRVKIIYLCLLIFSAGSSQVPGNDAEQGWVSLFYGTLNGWKASENTASFTIREALLPPTDREAISSMSGLWKMQSSQTSN